MILMRKGDAVEYVPDVFVDTYRKSGYVVDDEEVIDTASTGDESADDATTNADDAVEGNEDKFICTHCNKEYKSKANLDKHIAEKHVE